MIKKESTKKESIESWKYLEEVEEDVGVWLWVEVTAMDLINGG